MGKSKRSPANSGLGYIYATGLALASIVFVLVAVLGVILINGLGFFWPSDVNIFSMKDGSRVMGSVVQRAQSKGDRPVAEIQIKIANRDLNGLDHRWLKAEDVTETAAPANAAVLERMEYGDFVGFLGASPEDEEAALADYLNLRGEVDALLDEQEKLGERISELNAKIRNLEYEARKLELDNPEESNSAKIDRVNAKKLELERESQILIDEQFRLRKLSEVRKISVRDVNGQSKEIEISQIVRIIFPNEMGLFRRAAHYAVKLWELVSGKPREANTEGGVFPAIFGTVMMIFIMSVFSFPLGVMAAVYLRIYATEGWVVKTVRIAVNNLAGVPSIVFGVFGLGFFVYVVGGNIDALFYSERLPNPTFGTGGILWSSLTLALLTVPVVIVATEEALSSIPKGMYEASIALGATRLQTLFNILLPVASPGILTGFILAMARAAGEVAPLMITGVVKLTPNLAIDGTFPFFHLERKFMHLGFHIFDVGFQSPNVEAAKPMVYVTTILLLLIVLVMTGSAIYLREKLKKKFASRSI